MGKRKLKGYVIPTLTITLFAFIAMAIFMISEIYQPETLENKNDNQDYVVSPIPDNNDTPVVSEVELKVVKPYNNESVRVAKGFYDKDASVEDQQNALIYYEKTYMQNTGVLYESDETFDVLAVLDGTVKEVKEDELLGKVVIVEHDNNITSVYYSLDEVYVNVGDTVTQNMPIAKSGKNKINNTKDNNLLFEVYVEGKLTNPETFYEMKLDVLN